MANKQYLRGTLEDGTPWMGTADEYIEDLKQCLEAETRGHGEARKEIKRLKEQLRQLLPIKIKVDSSFR